MSIDLSQFLEIYYEESFENLDAMENSLLSLEVGDPDDEVINTIFRGAHSIKGGSGTFNLSCVTNFTHTLETLLDQLRSGERAVSQDLVDLLLKSTDCLREMLTVLHNNGEPDLTTADELQKQCQALLDSESDASPSGRA
ncbi:Hpt domain-containing protein [Piscirickettsia litoralis]|uniref:Hpt domain-containing protein n=1 Tax=Piscirickettsia litoralis TaxID=1891921 RepID=UPI000AA38D2C|nr:Hpt domain-containing protein [Piscirickettsia litoralis]